MTIQILFLCTHNSARSILAEKMCQSLAQKLGKDVVAHSAGSSPSGVVNSVALRVLGEAGIDVSDVRSKSWDEFSGENAPVINIVITVCGSAAGEVCPVWTGSPVQAHWGYADPSKVEGEEAKHAAFEITRQALGYKIMLLLTQPIEKYTAEQLTQCLADIAEG